MKLQINTDGKKYQNEGDDRTLLFRVLSNRYGNGNEGWKFSVSLHTKWFYWRKSFREFRATVFGLNIHFKA
jgi:hypothetical protein